MYLQRIPTYRSCILDNLCRGCWSYHMFWSSRENSTPTNSAFFYECRIHPLAKLSLLITSFVNCVLFEGDKSADPIIILFRSKIANLYTVLRKGHRRFDEFFEVLTEFSMCLSCKFIFRVELSSVIGCFIEGF